MFSICYTTRSRSLSFLFLLIAMLAARAQQPASTPGNTPDSDHTYAISGTVMNSVSGEAIKRALVVLSGRVNRATMTDGEGQFTFDNLTPDNYTITARKPGFFTEQEAQQSEYGQPNFVTAGPDASPVTIKLIPEGVISGTVVDAEGLPVANMPVRVIQKRIVEGQAMWQQINQKQTDENGVFKVAELPPGTYLVVTGPSFTLTFGAPGTVAKEAMGFPPTYYGGGHDRSSATPIELGAGQRVQADFTLTAEPFFRVTGGIVGAGPAEHVGINFVPKDPDELVVVPVRRNTDNNTFEAMNIPAGDYVIQAYGNDPDGHQLMGWTPVTVTSNVSGVQVALHQPIKIPIAVELQEARTQQPGGGVERPASQNNVPLVYMELHSTTNISQGGNGQAKADGGTIENVTPGKYSIRFHANFGWYVASAYQGDTDLLTNDLTVAAGPQQTPVSIVLRNDGATLHAGVPAENKTEFVLLLPDDSPELATVTGVYGGSSSGGSSGAASATTSATIANLRPGSYMVLAFDNIAGLEYKNMEALQPYLSRAARVNLGPNDESKVNLEVIRRDSE